MDSGSSSSKERDHSRLSVDNIEDWERVKTNFTEAMTGVLDTKTGPAGDPKERDVLLQHLTQWRNDAFELAKPNVRLNGVNMEDYPEEEDDFELESYDEALDARLWTHWTSRLAWDKTLAQRRREVPQSGEQLLEDLMMRQRAFEEEDMPPTEDMEIDPAVEGTGAPLERLDAIVSTHTAAMALLEQWRESAPKLIEKADRVEQVVITDAKLTP